MTPTDPKSIQSSLHCHYIDSNVEVAFLEQLMSLSVLGRFPNFLTRRMNISCVRTKSNGGSPFRWLHNSAFNAWSTQRQREHEAQRHAMSYARWPGSSSMQYAHAQTIGCRVSQHGASALAPDRRARYRTAANTAMILRVPQGLFQFTMKTRAAVCIGVAVCR
jgi:hypothetical protein